MQRLEVEKCRIRAPECVYVAAKMAGNRPGVAHVQRLSCAGHLISQALVNVLISHFWAFVALKLDSVTQL